MLDVCRQVLVILLEQHSVLAEADQLLYHRLLM